ncbi:MAG TPA: FUSC family protein [Dermatophilaceae bacterium]|nr:FUSC family protein [Dermatophilaceae bacterium]
MARRSHTAARRRLARLRERAVFIAQCGLAAAAAWFVAGTVLGHATPFFAPITAIVCLGLSFGQRLRRVLELMVGVAIGVLVGDLIVGVVGSGVWQLGLVVALAMALAALVGSGPLLTTQAGVQASVVVTLVAAPEQAFSRWLDAVVGGSVALAVAVVAPRGPVLRPWQEAAEVLDEISQILRETADGLRSGDPDAESATLERARATDERLSSLREAAAEGMAVVRLSPLRRHHAADLQAITDLVTPLDRCVRNLRVLVRRAYVATWREERVPGGYVALIDSLAESAEEVAAGLAERVVPVGAQRGLIAIGELSAVVAGEAGLSGEVVRAQIRSMVVDLLMLTGMDYDEAGEMVPESLD